MLRLAIQSKGRLNEESTALLREIGIDVDDSRRKFLAQAANFPLELLYMRDDDIPQVVSSGTASLGIVGLNEVAERGFDVQVVEKLGFGACRISLAVPKTVDYDGPQWFNGKRIATSYPNILRKWLQEQGIEAEIEVITGSVEIAPAADIADAIFDIVSSGGTLVSNGLREVEKIFWSEARDAVPFRVRQGQPPQEIHPDEPPAGFGREGHADPPGDAQPDRDAARRRGLVLHALRGGRRRPLGQDQAAQGHRRRRHPGPEY